VEQFADAPGLRHAAPGTVRCISIEDLWDLTDAFVVEISP
jgi:hypothetical protein